MSDDLDLRGIDQRHEPDPEFRAALERRIAANRRGHRSGLGDRDPGHRDDRPRTDTATDLGRGDAAAESPMSFWPLPSPRRS